MTTVGLRTAYDVTVFRLKYGLKIIRYIPTLNSRKRGGRDLYRATSVVAQDLGFLRFQGGWGVEFG